MKMLSSKKKEEEEKNGSMSRLVSFLYLHIQYFWISFVYWFLPFSEPLGSFFYLSLGTSLIPFAVRFLRKKQQKIKLTKVYTNFKHGVHMYNSFRPGQRRCFEKSHGNVHHSENVICFKKEPQPDKSSMRQMRCLKSPLLWWAIFWTME